MTEAERERAIAYWETHRKNAVAALGVACTKLAEYGVIYPLHLVDTDTDVGDNNVHQLKLAEPGGDEAA